MERRELTPEHLGLIESLLADGRTVRMTVTGHSMTPTIWGNEVVHLHRAQQVDVGEVVLVRAPGDRPLVHRVCASEHRDGTAWVQTRGDALAEPDGWFPSTNVIGRVTRVEPRLLRRALGALRRRASVMRASLTPGRRASTYPRWSQ